MFGSSLGLLRLGGSLLGLRLCGHNGFGCGFNSGLVLFGCGLGGFRRFGGFRSFSGFGRFGKNGLKTEIQEIVHGAYKIAVRVGLILDLKHCGDFGLALVRIKRLDNGGIGLGLNGYNNGRFVLGSDNRRGGLSSHNGRSRLYGHNRRSRLCSHNGRSGLSSHDRRSGLSGHNGCRGLSGHDRCGGLSVHNGRSGLSGHNGRGGHIGLGRRDRLGIIDGGSRRFRGLDDFRLFDFGLGREARRLILLGLVRLRHIGCGRGSGGDRLKDRSGGFINGNHGLIDRRGARNCRLINGSHRINRLRNIGRGNVRRGRGGLSVWVGVRRCIRLKRLIQTRVGGSLRHRCIGRGFGIVAVRVYGRNIARRLDGILRVFRLQVRRAVGRLTLHGSIWIVRQLTGVIVVTHQCPNLA